MLKKLKVTLLLAVMCSCQTYWNSIIPSSPKEKEEQVNIYMKKSDMEKAIKLGKKYGWRRNELAKMIRKFFQQEDYQHYVWFLDNGTLLASYRDGKMIPHDDDFDVGVYFPVYSQEKVNQLFEEIKKWIPKPYEARLIHLDMKNTDFDYADKIEVYDPTFGKKALRQVDYHHVSMDLQIYSGIKDTDQVIPHHESEQHCRIPVDSIIPVTRTRYEGESYPAPRNTKTYLEAKYGYIGPNAKFNPVTKFYEPQKQNRPHASKG